MYTHTYIYIRHEHQKRPSTARCAHIATNKVARKLRKGAHKKIPEKEHT